jgi:cytosine permease
VITLVYALFMPGETVVRQDSHLIEFGGISLVIATAIAAVIDLPTYFRHARSAKDGLISVVLIFAIAIPAIELVGVYLATYRGGESVIDILKGTNPLWNFWIAFFIVLAGWTTNNTNLYSGVISLEFIWPSSSSCMRTWAVGVAGTLLACCNLLDHLELILDLVGIGIGSMGAVVIISYMFITKDVKCLSTIHQRYHLGAWGLGAALGTSSIVGLFSVTSIAVLDAFLGASVGTLLLFINLRKTYVSIHNR